MVTENIEEGVTMVTENGKYLVKDRCKMKYFRFSCGRFIRSEF